MDKDNKEDFTFAKLSDLNLPVTFRMYGALDEPNVDFSDTIVDLS
jgi:hypothetical protein